jgi:iron complex transport system substrate-binding protein
MIRKELPALSFALLLPLLTLPAYGRTVSAPAGRVITDMAGRQVSVPAKIHKVYCMSPVCQILVYTLAPDLLAGWNYKPEPGEYALLVAPYRQLPVLGGWFGKSNTGNIEEIMKTHPDVMVSIGDPMATDSAERVQKQTHLPVFVGDWKLKRLDEAYLALGKLLGREKRAAELAAYCRNALRDVEDRIKTIPAAQRRRVYYAEGPTGLTTDPGRSAHSEAIIFAGGINVADVSEQGGFGQTPVSMEQVLKWNPDIVIAGYDHSSSPGEFYQGVWRDPLWQQIKAVKAKDVYEAPQYPFNWIDRPPSVNRIIGIKWLANLFYPNLFHYDIRKETRDFYLKFYHRKLSDSELDVLLAQAVKKP